MYTIIYTYDQGKYTYTSRWNGRTVCGMEITLYILRQEWLIHRVKANDLYVWQDYMHGDDVGGRCIFSVYLGMECRRAVGLFLPGVKKKKIETHAHYAHTRTHSHTEGEWNRARERLAVMVYGEGARERSRCVSLATGNFLLEPEWRTGVWLPNKSVASKNSNDRAKNKTISY